MLTSGEREVAYADTLVSFKCYFHSMFTKIPYPMLQVAAVSPGRHSQYKKHYIYQDVASLFPWEATAAKLDVYLK